MDERETEQSCQYGIQWNDKTSFPKRKGQIAQFEEDLLQMAQLRNAIVHERIADDFVIAEPNEWAVQRIETIEQALTKPEK